MKIYTVVETDSDDLSGGGNLVASFTSKDRAQRVLQQLESVTLEQAAIRAELKPKVDIIIAESQRLSKNGISYIMSYEEQGIYNKYLTTLQYDDLLFEIEITDLYEG